MSKPSPADIVRAFGVAWAGPKSIFGAPGHLYPPTLFTGGVVRVISTGPVFTRGSVLGSTLSLIGWSSAPEPAITR
jgi:hypothetical protein